MTLREKVQELYELHQSYPRIARDAFFGWIPKSSICASSNLDPDERALGLALFLEYFDSQDRHAIIKEYEEEYLKRKN